MTTAHSAVTARRDEIVARHGAWTAHDILLPDGTWTLGRPPGDPGSAPRMTRLAQTADDLRVAPWEEMRVLDLGALEGQAGIELALRGAHLVGIEGREGSSAKARFAAEQLGISHEWFTADVRELSVERHGTFDVVLCLGLLYHLDAASLPPFIARLGDVCTRTLIIDTHVAFGDVELAGLLARRAMFLTPPQALGAFQRVDVDGVVVDGRQFFEHPPERPLEERADMEWAWNSLDNDQSFWLTTSSLTELLFLAGFTTVTVQQTEPGETHYVDRPVIVAVKGRPQTCLSEPVEARRT